MCGIFQLKKSMYLRQVMTLLTGSILAQLLSLLAAPVLTRLYTPDAFGVLALFIAIVAVLAPGIGGRYDVALVVTQDSDDRIDFFFISLWLMLLICLLFLLMLVALPSLLINKNIQALGNWLWLTPLALFATGIVTALRAWANAIKDYRHLSYSVVVQTGSVSFSAIILGVVVKIDDGLMFANLIGLLLTCIYLVYLYPNLTQKRKWFWSRRKWELALRHKDYPLFNAPTNILNGVMTSLPVFFLIYYFSEVVVGYYALLMRVGAAPLSVIAEAVSRVNLKKIAELLEKEEDPVPYLRRVTFSLLVIAILITLLLIFIAPQLFSWIFGANWRKAGELLAILMPALGLQFVVSTLSLSFIAAGHLRLQAMWQVLSLLITLIVFLWAGRSGDIEYFFWCYMIKDVFLYVVYYYLLVFALRYPIRLSKVV